MNILISINRNEYNKSNENFIANSNTLFDYLQKVNIIFKHKIQMLKHYIININVEWLDPQHQRNVVPGDAWQSNVVESLLTGRPIAPPEFDTYVKNGRRTWRSLDGKQRIAYLY